MLGSICNVTEEVCNMPLSTRMKLEMTMKYEECSKGLDHDVIMGDKKPFTTKISLFSKQK